MISVERTHDHNKIFKVLENPVLFNCTYGQSNEPINLEGKDFLLISEDAETLGFFEIREFTKLTIEAHICVLPKYWKRTTEIVEAGEQWALKHGYTTIFTSVPKNCLHMLKFMMRMGFSAIGTIQNGIIYNKQIVDLFLFTKTIGEK